MRARNDSRCSGASSRQRCRSVAAQPITEAIGARSSCRDERDEVGAERPEPSKLLRRIPLGRVRAHVLNRETDLPREQRDQVDLVGRERVHRLAGDRKHPKQLRSRRERRDDAGPKPDPGQLLLLRVLRIRVHVAADDRLRLAGHVLEDGARRRPRRSAGVKALCLEAGVGHDDGFVSIDEDDRQALELEDPAELAEEAVERLLLLERGGESARDSVDGLELVGPAPKLVAQLLRLFGTRVGNGRLAPKPRGEPADEQAHEHLETERERDGVQVELAAVTVGTQHLPVRQERRQQERDDEAARDAKADSAFRDRQEERLPDRRIRFPGIEDNHEGAHDRDVERHREVREHALASR